MCPYTSCDNISSKLNIVEKATIDGIGELVNKYKLSSTLPNSHNEELILAKEQLIGDKNLELERLNQQKTRQYELLEEEVYTTEIFLERSQAIADKIQECYTSIENLEKELEHDRKLLAQQSMFVPKCENLLSHYWDWDIPTRNDILKELIEKVVYIKNTKNAFGHADDINFTLDIYPKIQ